MKFLSSLFVATLFTLGSLSAQSLSDVFDNNKRLVWYGLDFSQAKMIGSEGFSDPYKIVNYYFTNWNELVNTESEKYDLRAVMHRRDMEYVLNPVREQNDKVDSGVLVQGHLNKVTEDDVKKAVNSLNLKDEADGIGMYMVVENFDKPAEKGNYWIVFFSISSKDIIHMQRIDGPASGFGFRNYWARSFKGVLEKIEKRCYRKWRKDSQN
ncbi:MAG: hypothetical protein ACI85F_000178 [Bacteroidia bacterium]|jgi:hypothetical protein